MPVFTDAFYISQLDPDSISKSGENSYYILYKSAKNVIGFPTFSSILSTKPDGRIYKYIFNIYPSRTVDLVSVLIDGYGCPSVVDDTLGKPMFVWKGNHIQITVLEMGVMLGETYNFPETMLIVLLYDI